MFIMVHTFIHHHHFTDQRSVASEAMQSSKSSVKD
jgi:hypothetical protein